jgi:hypothetical protein
MARVVAAAEPSRPCPHRQALRSAREPRARHAAAPSPAGLSLNRRREASNRGSGTKSRGHGAETQTRGRFGFLDCVVTVWRFHHDEVMTEEEPESDLAIHEMMFRRSLRMGPGLALVFGVPHLVLGVLIPDIRWRMFGSAAVFVLTFGVAFPLWIWRLLGKARRSVVDSPEPPASFPAG